MTLPSDSSSATPAVRLFEQDPVSICEIAPGVHLVDFGRVAFGNLVLHAGPGQCGPVTVHFGEDVRNGRVNRTPPGSVRYARVALDLAGGAVVVAPPPDERNTSHPSAVLTPPEWGVVIPFRWVEVEGWLGAFNATCITRRAAFAAGWDDHAAAFATSDPMLNRIWDLCCYTIKATTFAGVYVDGDRERIAYEADAFINQISHYAVDHNVRMARATFDRLLRFPTWPTEWALHMVFIAHADWMHTGDRAWLARRFDALVSRIPFERVRADGLMTSDVEQMKKGDLVDWPPSERDSFVFTPINTVVNAFYLQSLKRLAELASALGRDDETGDYRARLDRGLASFQSILFDARRGLFRDGEGVMHASMHANLFPLAFGLAPEDRRSSIASWLAGRGMACSVYAAQYLLESLFENGRSVEALSLMTAPGDRSWRHMVESGATMTWEAWDQKYKPNQDWNHAWGAAPANLLPRFVLGVRPIEPGWTCALIRPCPGVLSQASGRVPTPRGAVAVEWKNESAFRLVADLPPGMSARIELPSPRGSTGVWSGGRCMPARRTPHGWLVQERFTGRVELDVR